MYKRQVQADMKLLRDVRYWINHVLPPDQRRVVPEPGKKPSINLSLIHISFPFRKSLRYIAGEHIPYRPVIRLE